jgi:hypothetical protein
MGTEESEWERAAKAGGRAARRRLIRRVLYVGAIAVGIVGAYVGAFWLKFHNKVGPYGVCSSSEDCFEASCVGGVAANGDQVCVRECVSGGLCDHGFTCASLEKTLIDTSPQFTVENGKVHSTGPLDMPVTRSAGVHQYCVKEADLARIQAR